ncbi:MAG: hypothetical protein LBC42_03270 [Puniceicoccales bacterium]|nr:hypothetical protein [Puniceicoccales bacterium]
MTTQQKTREKFAAAGAFTMDDVREVLLAREQAGARKAETGVGEKSPSKLTGKKQHKVVGKVTANELVASQKPTQIIASKRAAVSIVDILGFDPNAEEEPVNCERATIPEKWRRYFDLLIGMRGELQQRFAQHRDETLQPQGTEVGDPSGALRQSSIDGAAEHADLERALSFVENERELLREIDAALERMRRGTYGICEQTGDAIDPKRLTAIPFARHSLRGREEYERMLQEKKREHGLAFLQFDGDDVDAVNHGDEEAAEE